MLEVFEKLVAESEKKMDFSQKDYMMDGLLYCGKCRTQKQMRIQAVGTVEMQYNPCS